MGMELDRTSWRRALWVGLLSSALLVLWAAPSLTFNRLLATSLVALVAGATSRRQSRALGAALALAFVGSVAVWLGVESIPLYVVVGSVGRWATVAVVAAGLGRLLAMGAQRAVTAR